MRGFKKALIERALGAEMSHHLGYSPGAAKPSDVTNHRNGHSGKTVLTGEAALRIDVPRDREGSFEPQLIGKHERRFTGRAVSAWMVSLVPAPSKGILEFVVLAPAI